MRLLLASIGILLAGTSVITRAGESEFFPLGEGWKWSYIGDGGDAQSAYMDGFQEVQGRQTRVRHLQYSGDVNEVLDNYFTLRRRQSAPHADPGDILGTNQA